jgi:gliding motility-associated lipoprotein GldH
MKATIYLCVLLLTASIFTACQPEGRVYSKHKQLSPDVEWLKADVQEFEVPVEDNSLVYDLSLSFRYANGFQYKTAKVKVTETSPSGSQVVNEYDLKIREDNGDYIGEAGYDIWDSEHLVQAGKKFEEKGSYTYTIEHIMAKDPLYFAMEIGVLLDKSK